jgi:RNA polymerase sigma-70 factor (ECF subfamily)
MFESEEQRLVEQAGRDAGAFAALYDRYVDRIYAYARRQTADEALAQDVTSATFEKALRHIRRYRPQGKSFCAWLYRIARNEAISQQRKGRLLTTLFGRPAGGPTVEQAVQEREGQAALQAGLARLAPGDRELIGLRFFEELTSEEVAEVLGISRANVYLRLHRALGRLRQALEGQELPADQEVNNYVPRSF